MTPLTSTHPTLHPVAQTPICAETSRLRSKKNLRERELTEWLH
jgi:hypothetical protein